MNPILRNILGVIAGMAVGMLINGGLINISGSLIPLPEGVDPNDFESIKTNMHLYSPKHFLMPFLAHALGTLGGAFTMAKIAASHQVKLGLLIGAFFLIGGVMMVQMLPQTPTWFAALDILVAYLPMGWLGAKLANRG